MAHSGQLSLNKIFGHVIDTETLAPTAQGTIVAPTRVLKNTESGVTFFLDLSTETCALQLPAPEAGLNYRFIVTAIGASKDFAVFTDATTTDIFGIGLEAGAHDATAAAGVSTFQFDHSDGAVAIGDRLRITSDGTHWYIVDLVVTTATCITSNADHVIA